MEKRVSNYFRNENKLTVTVNLPPIGNSNSLPPIKLSMSIQLIDDKVSSTLLYLSDVIKRME